MKQLTTRLVTLVTLLITYTATWAHDFEVNGIYYKILSSTDKTVAVTYKGDNPSIVKTYSGNVELLPSVTYSGTNYTVVAIDDNAFFCNEVSNVTIPNSIKSIGESAFDYCSINTVVIPGSVNSIGLLAFACCENLASAIIEEGVTEIGTGMFSGCTNLTSVTIPSTVTTLGDGSFSLCDKLTSIYIPNSVTSIGDQVFSSCANLTSVMIPSSVTSIGIRTFEFCNSLTNISIDKANRIYDSRNNCNAIIESATDKLIEGCNTTIVPNSVKEIGDNAFWGCRELTSLIIPNNVVSIGMYTFVDCDNLSSVTIGSSVTSIGREAFGNCNNLTSVTNLSHTPQKIGYLCFAKYGTLHVPYGCKNAYEKANYWKNFTIIEDAEEPLPEPDPQCAAPVITVNNGTVSFSCETEGAVINHTITSRSFGTNGTDTQVKIIPTPVTYTITAYATAKGYLNSETVTKSFTINALKKGDVNGDNIVNINDVTEVINIICTSEQQ